MASVGEKSVAATQCGMTPCGCTAFHNQHRGSEATLADLWGPALGHGPRENNDPMINAYRIAIGIPLVNPIEADPRAVEEGIRPSRGLPDISRRRKYATGLYQLVLKSQHTKQILLRTLNFGLYVLYILQVILGAVMTALGPLSGTHPIVITIFAVANTCIAAFLALIQGQSLPERLRKDEIEYRKVRDFIEETEALLLAGMCGRDLEDVGRLVEMTFRMGHLAKMSEEDNLAGGGGGGGFGRQNMSGGRSGQFSSSRF